MFLSEADQNPGGSVSKEAIICRSVCVQLSAVFVLAITRSS